MREALRELGEGFAVYSAELKRAATRLHVYGHYRPFAVRRSSQYRSFKSAKAATQLHVTGWAGNVQESCFLG